MDIWLFGAFNLTMLSFFFLKSQVSRFFLLCPFLRKIISDNNYVAFFLFSFAKMWSVKIWLGKTNARRRTTTAWETCNLMDRFLCVSLMAFGTKSCSYCRHTTPLRTSIKIFIHSLKFKCILPRKVLFFRIFFP